MSEMIFSTVTPNEAIKLLKRRGRAFVNANLTKNDSHRVEVVKADLVHLFRQFETDAQICVMHWEARDGSTNTVWDSYAF